MDSEKLTRWRRIAPPPDGQRTGGWTLLHGLDKWVRLGALVVVLFVGARARGQTFPPNGKWIPLPCGKLYMFDGYRDFPGAIDDLDIVGTQAQPAGFRYSDKNYLYIRLRFDKDPAPGGALRPSAWGIEVDLDGDPTTYEALISVGGSGPAARAVRVYRNTVTTNPDSAADPADSPELTAHPFSTFARTVVTFDSSSFGGDPDYFLDFAVPWADLAPLGFAANTKVGVWAGSSTLPDRLDLDLACHDGAIGLSGVDTSVHFYFDPDLDSDGDGDSDAADYAAGANPYDPSSRPSGGANGGTNGNGTNGGANGGRGPNTLEGGPGCTVGGSGAGASALGLVGLLLVMRRRRRMGT
jgi:hypothetical protein